MTQISIILESPHIYLDIKNSLKGSFKSFVFEILSQNFNIYGYPVLELYLLSGGCLRLCVSQANFRIKNHVVM